MMHHLALITLALLCLTGCTTPPAPGTPHPYEHYLNNPAPGMSHPDDLQGCSLYDCGFRDRV